MKCGSNPKGFTIVETMIFLAVSGALLFSAMSLMSGSQGRAQFNDAINDVQQKIDLAAGDLSTGYYGGSETVTCGVNGSGNPEITAGPGERGTNKGCQFIGRLVTFPSTDKMELQSIYGLTKTVSQDVTKLSEARPQIFTASTDTITFKYGLEFTKIKDHPGDKRLGFFSAFPKEDALGAGILESGSLQNDFAIVPSTGFTAGFISAYDATASTTKNPSAGVTLCFKSGTNNQEATITIGGDNRNATSTKLIGSAGSLCP